MDLPVRACLCPRTSRKGGGSARQGIGRRKNAEILNKKIDNLQQVKKSEGATPVGIIAVGYGQTQGTQHKMKKAEDVSAYVGDAPGWFREGVDAALLAPTALAKQAFFIKGEGSAVHIDCDNGIFSGVDTGLVKYHFELGAGKGCFEWV